MYILFAYMFIVKVACIIILLLLVQPWGGVSATTPAYNVLSNLFSSSIRYDYTARKAKPHQSFSIPALFSYIKADPKMTVQYTMCI